MNFSKFEALNKEQAQSVKGGLFGRKRSVTYKDVDGNGVEDKVIIVRDSHGRIVKKRIIYK